MKDFEYGQTNVAGSVADDPGSSSVPHRSPGHVEEVQRRAVDAVRKSLGRARRSKVGLHHEALNYHALDQQAWLGSSQGNATDI